MDNFDKKFAIITITIVLALFIAWAVWFGFTLQEFVNALPRKV